MYQNVKLTELFYLPVKSTILSPCLNEEPTQTSEPERHRQRLTLSNCLAIKFRQPLCILQFWGNSSWVRSNTTEVHVDNFRFKFPLHVLVITSNAVFLPMFQNENVSFFLVLTCVPHVQHDYIFF